MKKGEAVEEPEDRRGYGPGVGDGSDREGGAEPCSCTERNWRCDNFALMIGRNHLTGNVGVVGTWTAYALDRKAVNEQMLSVGDYEKECVGGTSS